MPCSRGGCRRGCFSLNLAPMRVGVRAFPETQTWGDDLVSTLPSGAYRERPLPPPRCPATEGRQRGEGKGRRLVNVPQVVGNRRRPSYSRMRFQLNV